MIRGPIKNKPELLAPAGNMEKLKFAIQYGANAVYIGGQSLGLRANADNFSFAEMKEAADFAHHHGAKVFVATNIIAHNEDLHEVDQFMKNIERAGIDAIIVADPALIERTTGCSIYRTSFKHPAVNHKLAFRSILERRRG